MIQISGLTKFYGTFLAIDQLSFSVQAREVVALLGLNGAGKTTTLRILTGFLSPTRGTVTMNSFDLLKQPMDIKRQIGYLPEIPALYPDMRVVDFLRYMYRVRLYTKKDEEASIQSALQKTNIEDRAHSYIGNLSAGYRKRVGIAQAMVHKPPVLIFDEPISELDPLQIVEIRNLILTLKKDHTILISSHILSEVSQTADRFLFIKEGRLVGEETKSTLGSGNMTLEKRFMEINQK